MTAFLRSAGAALSARLRRLDRRLHIDHRGRSEWIWAAPLGTLLGTVALICFAGVSSGVGAAMFVPVGVLLGVVMAGMSIAYMTPAPDTEPPGDDDGGHGRPEPAGPSAPPWYRRLVDTTQHEPSAAERGAERRERTPTH